MSINLAAVCDKEIVSKILEQTCEKLGYKISCEIQLENNITDELCEDTLDNASAILIVTQKEIQQIAKMDRFKHRNYYQVLPIFVIQDAKSIIREIVKDIK